MRLPQTYRSLSRPSSALDAKAFPLRSYQLDRNADLCRSATGSHQELCRLQIRFIVVLCYPFKKSTKVYFVTSLLLARNFLLAFTVQFSRYRRRRSKVHSVRNILSDIPHFISLLLLFLANPLALGFARSWMTFFWSKTRLKCSDACPNTSIHSWWRLPDSNRCPLACKASVLPAELNPR